MTNIPTSLWWQDPAAAREGEHLPLPEPEHAGLHAAPHPHHQDDGPAAGGAQARGESGRQERLRRQGDDPHVGPEQDQGLPGEFLKPPMFLE